MAANMLAALLAQNLTLDEQNVVGNLLTAAGATLLSIAAVGESCRTDSTSAAGETGASGATGTADATGASGPDAGGQPAQKAAGYGRYGARGASSAR